MTSTNDKSESKIHKKADKILPLSLHRDEVYGTTNNEMSDTVQKKKKLTYWYKYFLELKLNS